MWGKCSRERECWVPRLRNRTEKDTFGVPRARETEQKRDSQT